MDNITKILENKYPVALVIENHQDPSDGSLSLSAKLIDGYADEELVSVSWHYNLKSCLRELDKKCEAIASATRTNRSSYLMEDEQFILG